MNRMTELLKLSIELEEAKRSGDGEKVKELQALQDKFVNSTIKHQYPYQHERLTK